VRSARGHRAKDETTVLFARARSARATLLLPAPRSAIVFRATKGFAAKQLTDIL
jgi:hypothetical protein